MTADRRLERLRDAFVGAVSHELRTPLTSISGFLEMLGDEEDELGSRRPQYLSSLRRSTGRLQRSSRISSLSRRSRRTGSSSSLWRPTSPSSPPRLSSGPPAAAERRESSCGSRPRADCRSKPTPGGSGRCSTTSSRTRSSSRPSGGSVILSASNGDGPVTVEVTDTGIGIPQRRGRPGVLALLPGLDRHPPRYPGHRPRARHRAGDRRRPRWHDLPREHARARERASRSRFRCVRLPLARRRHVAVAETAHRLDRLEAVRVLAELLAQIRDVELHLVASRRRPRAPRRAR